MGMIHTYLSFYELYLLHLAKFLYLAVAVVDILNGASYLFGYATAEGSPKWKEMKDIDEIAKAVRQQKKVSNISEDNA